jgi:hypothetical protein
MATAAWFGNALVGQFSSTAARRVDWDADTIMCSLHQNTFSPNVDTQDFWDDVSATELAATGGYTTKGVALTTIAPAYTAGSNTTVLDANDAVWNSATFSAYYAIIWKDTGTASTSPLLGYVDFQGVQTVSSGTFTIQWASDGVLKIVS